MPEIAHGAGVFVASSGAPRIAFHAETTATKTPFGWAGVLVALTALLAFELIIMWVDIGQDVYNIDGVDGARSCLRMNVTQFLVSPLGARWREPPLAQLHRDWAHSCHI